MSDHMHHTHSSGQPPHAEHDSEGSFWKSKFGFVLIGFGLIAAFFLLSEHWAHALGFLPYLLILACPLMHIFMHHGHGGHGSHGGEKAPSKETGEKKQ
jgi:cell division protein FtsW (lipid II flippase)